ncbi:ester cyclase [Rhizobium sp. 2MFCol3.1]|uniref:ester cyclase n=1 Tax=Rhizobium sp. 2MFCol3.1 TaxID=1246459 RepID=UPI00035CDC9A|nr:ester cyclase [Rhizobium sp. 2MFCol3.1]
MPNETEIRSSGISEADLQMLKTFYRAFAGEPALLDDCVTADWQDIPLAPGQATGRDGAKPLIEGFGTVFAELRIEILEVIGGPNRAAVRAVMKGRHVGELLGVAPTQKEFALPIHEFHAFENGRLTRTHHMEDWMGWFAQVGAAPNAA